LNILLLVNDGPTYIGNNLREELKVEGIVLLFDAFGRAEG
jgi:hypothetical protein